MSWIDKAIEAAQKLGGLSAAAIFALISMGLGYMLYRKDRFSEDSNEKWRATREAQIRAEEGQTQIMAKSVDTVVMLVGAINVQSSRLDHLATLIDERIPKGGNHV